MIAPAPRPRDADEIPSHDSVPRERAAVALTAALPDLVTPAILAAAVGMTPRAVCRQILAGSWGPYTRLGRRLILRRDSLLAALAEREVHVAPRAPVPVARPPAWASHLPPPHPGRRPA
ncbi:MAG: hypothetical protein JNM10_07080 [Planctomycetia bacterium]|nr:hypothetical protein [Planctomycetia bacterium]